MKPTMRFAELLLVLAIPAISAHGQNCSFVVSGTTMTLKNDCTITETITIPDGMTLDGKDHSMTAVIDPNTGTFNGDALIQTEGSVAHLKNLILDAPNLPGDSQNCPGLVGVFFTASGSIINNHILHMGRNCGSGAGIFLYAFDCDETQTVTITGNTLYLPNAFGLYIGPGMQVAASKNLISAEMPVNFWECSSGSLTNNDIEATSKDFPAIELQEAKFGTKIANNNINMGAGLTSIAISVGSDSAIITGNHIFNFGPAATPSNPIGGSIAIQNFGDLCPGGSCNKITNNTARCYATPFVNVSSSSNVTLPCPF
jgi:hypothetical protein